DHISCACPFSEVGVIVSINHKFRDQLETGTLNTIGPAVAEGHKFCSLGTETCLEREKPVRSMVALQIRSKAKLIDPCICNTLKTKSIHSHLSKESLEEKRRVKMERMFSTCGHKQYKAGEPSTDAGHSYINSIYPDLSKPQANIQKPQCTKERKKGQEQNLASNH
ncbi:hypothetical protein QQP08_005126, partial [Theobroma cacao]